MAIYLKEMLSAKGSELKFYSPYSFLREFNSVTLVDETVIKPLLQDISKGLCEVEEVIEKGQKHYFIFKNLKWDSEYFNFSVNKLDLILFDHNQVNILNGAIQAFIQRVIKSKEYFFFNIPCEETFLIQAISQTGFKLVETRLNYFLPDIQHFESPRQKVRKASIDDIAILKSIAINMRNVYDRVHADPAFSPEVADAYLGTFVEESVKGFSDVVIIPDIPGVEPFGFLAANYPQKILEKNIAKLVLAAVDNSLHKGWLFKLLSEVIYELKEYSTDYLTTITQASNRPAIHTWEKAGFKLGYITHIYSYFHQ